MILWPFQTIAVYETTKSATTMAFLSHRISHNQSYIMTKKPCLPLLCFSMPLNNQELSWSNVSSHMLEPEEEEEAIVRICKLSVACQLQSLISNTGKPTCAHIEFSSYHKNGANLKTYLWVSVCICIFLYFPFRWESNEVHLAWTAVSQAVAYKSLLSSAAVG